MVLHVRTSGEGRGCDHSTAILCSRREVYKEWSNALETIPPDALNRVKAAFKRKLLSCYFPLFPSIFLKSFCIVGLFSFHDELTILPLNAKRIHRENW